MRLIQAGTADQSIVFRALTSAGATATPAYNDAGIAATYKRDATGVATTITLATQTSTGAHSDGGLVHIGGGVCRLDLPDAAVADGATRVTVTVNATAWVGFAEDILLVDYDPTGPVNANVTAMAAGAITAASIASDAITDAKVASDVTIASVTGAVGSVTGAVGSVTGAVGSVAAGGITAASIATGAIDADALAADAVAEIAAAITAGATAAEVWSYASRTLTQSAASVTAAVSGSTIAATRGDTLTAAITGLGAITGYTALWFTVKAAPTTEADSAAKVQITQAGGLIYLNGAAATAGQGSITVNSAATGAITIVLAAAASAALAAPSAWIYDVQWKDAGGLIHTLTRGTFLVTDDVTRATS